jgi:hypothetical protein
LRLCGALYTKVSLPRVSHICWLVRSPIAHLATCFHRCTIRSTTTCSSRNCWLRTPTCSKIPCRTCGCWHCEPWQSTVRVVRAQRTPCSQLISRLLVFALALRCRGTGPARSPAALHFEA